MCKLIDAKMIKGKNLCMHILIYVCMACIYVCMYVCMCVCVCVCVCMCVCMYEFPDDNKQEILKQELFNTFD